MTARNEITYQLQTGELKVSIEEKHSVKKAMSLFKVAERYNPKRSFLFVSTVLGKHYPSRVSHMMEAIKELSNKLPGDIHKYAVIGMAETAVGLSAVIFQDCIDRFGYGIYGTSTRYPNGEVFSNFSEPHSHAAEQCLCKPKSAAIMSHLRESEDLILVDDELTTGRTMNNLAKVLINQAQTSVKRIFILSLTDWSQGQLILDIPNHIEVHFLSLVKGDFFWVGNGNSYTLPPFTETASDISSRMVSINSPRNWVDSLSGNHILPEALQRFIHNTRVGELVLVIGTGEFMSKPWYLARAIEEAGALAYLCSTTRSPAMTGNEVAYFSDYGVSSRIVFSDIYKNDGQNYLYNFNIEKWDKVVIYTDAKYCNLPSDLLDQVSPDLVFSEFELAG